MRARSVAEIVLLAMALPCGQVAAAQAQPPLSAADHVTCIVHAIPPYKAGNAANAPIAFGYQVHCTSRPDGRNIEYVLQKNGSTAAFGSSKSTDPDKTEVFFYECSSGGSISQFTTYVAMIGQHVNIDFSEDTSGTVTLQC
ncbi:hypothetical protein DFR70_109184 [Nocardia tenerifensis]|uniref:Peptidase inhibitor family I36 n=1 Tax=Nocardia tenerifensis TaxID=228006 RepID=A0A318K9E8_9NOCA|nr:hypothetical protein DFR70_109184 [Nocardia tenerifensis]